MKCRRCKDEYEPKYLECGKDFRGIGVRILIGCGYCPACSQIVYDEEVAKEKAINDAKVEATRYDCIGKSGIPPRFLTESFSSFDKGWQDKALAYCKKWAENFPVDKRPVDYPSLYLWAKGESLNPQGNGTGKTHLSCAIALRIIERWTGAERGCPRIYFVSEPDLFRQIQATYSFTREEEKMRDSEDDILRRLISCDLLILDDVGKQKKEPKWNPITRKYEELSSAFVQRTLFGIIDGRYKRKLPMILTANVNGDGLKAHLGDASFDRFFETIHGKSVCMDGLSYRRR